jgi:hypothetical protein
VKQEFTVVDYHAEVIMGISKNASEFSKMWSEYLQSAGWTEEAYEAELDQQIWKSDAN